MPISYMRPLSLALGAIAVTALGGCYSDGVYGAGYASGSDCAARYGSAYYDYDGYAYDDGYGYDCYDASDYGGGFVNIGFGGGWYDDYYYPGYGTWMFDRYRNRYPLRDQYLNYWGGRRAWWRHHGGRGDGQFFLAGKMVKEAALRQASCGADILNAGGVVTLLPDDVEGRIQNFEA